MAFGFGYLFGVLDTYSGCLIPMLGFGIPIWGFWIPIFECWIPIFEFWIPILGFEYLWLIFGYLRASIGIQTLVWIKLGKAWQSKAFKCRTWVDLRSDQQGQNNKQLLKKSKQFLKGFILGFGDLCMVLETYDLGFGDIFRVLETYDLSFWNIFLVLYTYGLVLKTYGPNRSPKLKS